MKKGCNLFTYGTLRRGENNGMDKKMTCSFIQADKINGELFNLGWYPGVKDVSVGSFDYDKPAVTGDVFRLNSDDLVAQLDAYEGYPNLYNRIETETEGGLIVWVYTYNHPVQSDQLIASGDWKERTSNTASFGR